MCVSPFGRLRQRNVRRQISFNACNQLWNADRLGEKWMSLDLQAPILLQLSSPEPSKRQPVFRAMSDRIQYI